jgi:hypothetical protein
MRSLLGWAVAALGAALLLPAGAAAQQRETPSAKATRKKLEMKISVEWDNVPLKVAVDDLKAEFDNRLGVKIDNVSGVSNNTKVTYKAENQSLKKILGDLCTKYDWGYIVKSEAGNRYDGWIIIRKSAERGYEKGAEPKGGGAKESSAAPARPGPALARPAAPALSAALPARR